MELSNQKNDIKTKNPTKDSEKTPKIAYESEIEDYLSKTDFLKLRTPENIPETHPKNSKNNTNPHKNSNNHDNNDNPPSKNEGSNKKALEHSKSKEKIIQQAFFSNINNSYGSLTNQRTIVSRNMSNGGIKTPNMEKTPINNNNIGVSYNVNSVRSPKVNNVGQNQKIKVFLKKYLNLIKF